MKEFIQPFSRKPATIEEAMKAVQLAETEHEQALKERRSKYWTHKGRQKRDDKVVQTRNALEDAKADLESLQNPKVPEPTLFPELEPQ